MTRPRLTRAVERILLAMIREPTREVYGLELCEATGLPSGTIYPALARLERAGWLRSEWESGLAGDANRPLRRYYLLTEDGAAVARGVRADAPSLAPVRLRPA